MKMIETGKYILDGGIYYFRIISAMIVVVIFISVTLAALLTTAALIEEIIYAILQNSTPIIIDIIECILEILMFSILVWIFITYPMYKKGKELKKDKELKKITGEI